MRVANRSPAFKMAMEELFITKIHIHEVRHLKDFDIPLSETERKHLILTGRNGSGKTSVLEALHNQIGTNPYLANWYYSSLVMFAKVFVEFTNIDPQGLEEGSSTPIYAYFPAKRGASFEVPAGPRLIEFSPQEGRKAEFGKLFVQHLVNLWVGKSLAREENDEQAIRQIDHWFTNFTKQLVDLIGDETISLKFDKHNWNFIVQEKGKLPYTLNELSDGYASILGIVGELLIICEAQKIGANEAVGIVLIDEIETHLHIDLQKKVMPFLTSFFPRIQFIVTTHSPFVLASVKNAVICDLEKHIVTEDLSGYSSEMIVESYFGMDKYSQILKDQVDEYERLMANEEPSLEDEDRIDELEGYFETLPKYLSDELTIKLQQIRLKNLKLQK